MIRYRCSHCAAELKSSPLLVGKPDTCPICSKSTIVPRQSTVGIGALLRNTPKGAFLAGMVSVLVLLVVLTAWLVLRDTWERDHRTDILRLSEESISLIQAKRIADGVAKYDELLQLVGKHKLANPDIKKAMNDVSEVAEPLWHKFNEDRRLDAQRQKEAEVITKLLRLESQAESFVNATDFEQGIEKYQQALDLIKNIKSDNAEYVAALGRISQAKNFAIAKLNQKRRDDESANKRIEEEKRIASIKAHIKGGAWLTKESGRSETLRGLKISVLRSPGTNQQLLDMLYAVIDDYSLRLTEAKKKLADNEKEARTSLNPNDEYYQDKVRSSKIDVNWLQKTLTSLQDQLAIASNVEGSVPVDMATIYALYPTLPSIPTAKEIKVWAAIRSQQIAGRVHTDVDGKYSIEVTGGYYYLDATFYSSGAEVNWFVPVRVGDAKDIAVDLHNENAQIIKP